MFTRSDRKISKLLELHRKYTMSTPEHLHQDSNTLLGVIAERIDYLHSDVGDMKVAMKELASAIVKLALVEERQGQAAVQQQHTVAVLNELDARVTTLELAAPETKRNNAWINQAVWAAVCLIAVIVLDKVGIL